MAASRLSDHFQSLPPPARLATVGIVVVAISFLLPWYGVQFTGGLAKSGVDSFGFGQLALLLTIAAALLLIVGHARGYRLPRPLREGTLLALAGAWATLLCGYLMLDRPDDIAGLTNIRLRYGIFVALGGAVTLLVGGLRLRHDEAREGDGG